MGYLRMRSQRCILLIWIRRLQQIPKSAGGLEVRDGALQDMMNMYIRDALTAHLTPYMPVFLDYLARAERNNRLRRQTIANLP